MPQSPDAGLLARVSPVIKGKQDILIDLFGRPSERQDRPRLIALRRAGGNGTIIGAFDDEGIRYWGLRVAVQRAIEETVSMQGILYVAVTDEGGEVIGSLGDLPESQPEKDPLLRDLLESKISSANRKSKLKGRNLLEVFSPIYLETTGSDLPESAWKVTGRMRSCRETGSFSTSPWPLSCSSGSFPSGSSI